MHGLQWDDKKNRQLMETIRVKSKRKMVSFGVSCVYFLLNKKVGAKLYKSKKVRDCAYNKQLYAAEHNLAPAVGDCFSLDCFWIEHVPCCCPEIKYRKIHGYITQNVKIDSKKEHSEYSKLKYKLSEIGLLNEDLLNDNVGIVDGKLVCIDFDSCSCKWRNIKKKVVKYV